MNSTLPMTARLRILRQQDSAHPSGPGTARPGFLLHVTSLPSRYGIGDVGPSAFAWVDRLAAAGQTWWQVLPLGPTGYGHSPYQALSSFAANPLVISPDQLIEDGLLEPDDCEIVPSLPTTSISKGSFRSRSGCSLAPGKTSAAGRARICAPRSSSFARKRPICRRSPRCSWRCGPNIGERPFRSGRPAWPGVNRRLSRRRGRSRPTRSTSSASASSSCCGTGKCSRSTRICAACGCWAIFPSLSPRIRPTCGPTPSCS